MKLQAKKTTQVVDVAIRNLRSSDAATIRARGAVDLIFHFLCDRFEPAFDEVMAPEPGAKSPVFFPVLLPVALDLYEVC